MNRAKKLFILVVISSLVLAFLAGVFKRFRPGVPGREALALLRIQGPILDVRWYIEEVERLRDNIS